MLNHLIPLRRHTRLLAPLLAAIVAGAAVAGVSLAKDSTSASRSASSTTGSGAAQADALALQSEACPRVGSVVPHLLEIPSRRDGKQRPSARDAVEGAVALGDLQRMVVAEHEDVGREPDALGARSRYPNVANGSQ